MIGKLRLMDAQFLELQDNTFDSTVATFVFVFRIYSFIDFS